MAIADTITSMQTHTSNAYTMIGYGTDLTGINKNLENLSSTIFNAFLEALRNPDTLFTNLPKKSGTGANITLNNTANAPMRIELGATELTQDGTPTPSSPQDIHTISGSNKVVVCGKNLINLTAFSGAFNTTTYTNMGNVLEVKNQYGSISRNLDISSNTYKQTNTNAYDTSQIWKFINLKPNTQYTISCNMTTNKTSGNVNIFGTNRAYNIGTISQNFTTDANGEKEYSLMFYGSAGNGNYVELSNLQLELGTATTYEPYISQEAEVDLGYENLAKFTPNTYLPMASNVTILDLGKDVTFDSITTSIFYEDAIYTNSGGGFINYQLNDGTNQYKLAGHFGTNINTLCNGQYSLTQTNITFRKIIVTTYPTFTQGRMSIQVEKGSVAHSYTEYGKALEYCKIGNYEDKFIRSNDGTWQLEKNIGKVVLDGTETWTNSGSDATNYYYMMKTVINDLKSASSDNEIQPVFCNYFPHGFSYNGLGNSTAGTNGICVAMNHTLTICNQNYSKLQTADFKTWLGTTNPNVYYILATPIYTQITGTLANQLENIYQKLLSYSGTTNISQVNNDLSFNLSVSAIEEL